MASLLRIRASPRQTRTGEGAQVHSGASHSYKKGNPRTPRRGTGARLALQLVPPQHAFQLEGVELHGCVGEGDADVLGDVVAAGGGHARADAHHLGSASEETGVTETDAGFASLAAWRSPDDERDRTSGGARIV